MKPAGIVFLALGLLLFSCSNTGRQDVHTMGEFSLVVDENDSMIIDTQLETFVALYPNVKAKVQYGGENRALDLLNKDSVRVAIMHRNLSKNELESFKARDIYPKSYLIAFDAVTFIVNRNNPDTSFNPSELRDILTGKITRWNQLNPALPDEKIIMVFDNPGSANYMYLKDSLCSGADISKNVSALHGNRQVIRYVASNPYAIGVVGMNWVADRFDPESEKLASTVRIAAVRSYQNTWVKPSPWSLSKALYPFYRPVYAVVRGSAGGAGMGFVTFLSGEKGQLLMDKSGLLSTYRRFNVREVKIKQ